MILWEQMAARGASKSTWKYKKLQNSGRVLLALNVPALYTAGGWESVESLSRSRLGFGLPEPDTGL